MSNILDLLFDSYERKARLFPGLLTLLPLVSACLSLYPVELDKAGALAGIIAYCGGGFFLSSLARARGKAIEKKLYEQWGGTPTTQLLRHRYEELNSTTRARYYTWLQSLIPGLQMPTEEAEKADPSLADEVYASCIDWLRERTRDREKFPLVFKELTNYGYSRNLLGLKSIGVTLALLGVLLGLLRITGVISIGTFPLAWASCALSFVMLLVWLMQVRPVWVRVSAFAYASALLAALQKIVEPTSMSKSPLA